MEHYVYIHRRADTGDIFYVGKGKRNRAWTSEGRNPDWHATVAEGGLVVEPIAYFHEHADAIEHEKTTIRELGLWEPLVNRTCGGEGCAGHTPETLAAMSIRSKALHEDPEYKAKMARVYADPEYIAKQKARYATPESREAQRQQSLRHMPPEDRALRDKNLAAREAKRKYWADKRAAKEAEVLRRRAAHQEKLAKAAVMRAQKKLDSAAARVRAREASSRRAEALVAAEARREARRAARVARESQKREVLVHRARAQATKDFRLFWRLVGKKIQTDAVLGKIQNFDF